MVEVAVRTSEIFLDEVVASALVSAMVSIVEVEDEDVDVILNKSSSPLIASADSVEVEIEIETSKKVSMVEVDTSSTISTSSFGIFSISREKFSSPAPSGKLLSADSNVSFEGTGSVSISITDSSEAGIATGNISDAVVSTKLSSACKKRGKTKKHTETAKKEKGFLKLSNNKIMPKYHSKKNTV